MKKHKMEFVALTLLLGVLCYAFFDESRNSLEKDIVLTNHLYTMNETEAIAEEDITVDMIDLSLIDKDEPAFSLSFDLNHEDDSIPYNEIISNQVVDYALKFVGNPYVYGGNSLTNGTDCSGFTKLIYAKYGINLSRTAPSQTSSGRRISIDNIMPGDLVFQGYGGVIGHVAIYIGDNKLVHALNSNVGIVVTDLYIMPVLDVRRVI